MDMLENPLLAQAQAVEFHWIAFGPDEKFVQNLKGGKCREIRVHGGMEPISSAAFLLRLNDQRWSGALIVDDLAKFEGVVHAVRPDIDLRRLPFTVTDGRKTRSLPAEKPEARPEKPSEKGKLVEAVEQTTLLLKELSRRSAAHTLEALHIRNARIMWQKHSPENRREIIGALKGLAERGALGVFGFESAESNKDGSVTLYADGKKFVLTLSVDTLTATVNGMDIEHVSSTEKPEARPAEKKRAEGAEWGPATTAAMNAVGTVKCKIEKFSEGIGFGVNTLIDNDAVFGKMDTAEFASGLARVERAVGLLTGDEREQLKTTGLHVVPGNYLMSDGLYDSAPHYFRGKPSVGLGMSAEAMRKSISENLPYARAINNIGHWLQFKNMNIHVKPHRWPRSDTEREEGLSKEDYLKMNDEKFLKALQDVLYEKGERGESDVAAAFRDAHEDNVEVYLTSGGEARMDLSTFSWPEIYLPYTLHPAEMKRILLQAAKQCKFEKDLQRQAYGRIDFRTLGDRLFSPKNFVTTWQNVDYKLGARNQFSSRLEHALYELREKEGVTVPSNVPIVLQPGGFGWKEGAFSVERSQDAAAKNWSPWMIRLNISDGSPEEVEERIKKTLRESMKRIGGSQKGQTVA